MAKKSNNGWWILITALGVGLLYYIQTGVGYASDSNLIPNSLEERVDALVAELNSRFGKRWGDLAVAVLKYQLEGVLPAPLVDLVGVVAYVENESKRQQINRDEKLQLAVQIVRAQHLA